MADQQADDRSASHMSSTVQGVCEENMKFITSARRCRCLDCAQSGRARAQFGCADLRASFSSRHWRARSGCATDFVAHALSVHGIRGTWRLRGVALYARNVRQSWSRTFVLWCTPGVNKFPMWRGSRGWFAQHREGARVRAIMGSLRQHARLRATVGLYVSGLRSRQIFACVSGCTSDWGEPDMSLK